LLLWVEDRSSQEQVHLFNEATKSGVLARLFTYSFELKNWLSEFRLTYPHFNDKNLRVVTTRFRKDDEGREQAGFLLIQWLKLSSNFPSVETVLFCRNRDLVANVHQPCNKVWVSADMREMTGFVSFQEKWESGPVLSSTSTGISLSVTGLAKFFGFNY